MRPCVLHKFFKSASKLEEFGGGSFNIDPKETTTYNCVSTKASINGLIYIYGDIYEVLVVYPHCSPLKKLDLQYTFLNTEDLCQLIQKCSNLEVLVVHNLLPACILVPASTIIRSILLLFECGFFSSSWKLLRVVSFNEFFFDAKK